MQIKKYKFKIIIFLLIIIFSCFCGYILNDYLNKPEITPETDLDLNIYTPNDYKSNITAETIIKGINSESKIISTSVNLSCEIKIEESFFDLNILRKTQVLRFYGTALYTISLENLSKDDIYIGESFVKIYIDKPKLYALNLDSEKTVIERVERGLLSFGAIKMKPEDYKNMQIMALSKMTAQLDGSDIKIFTEENAKKAAADFFQAVLAVLSEENKENKESDESDENMTVEMTFK